MPPRLSSDIQVLHELGFDVNVIEDGTRYYVILKGFKFPADMYAPSVADLMIMADYQYPMSRLDMFWTDPVVKLASGAFPNGAANVEAYGGRRWQRWSWHYNGWSPSKHSLMTHIEVFLDRLARGC